MKGLNRFIGNSLMSTNKSVKEKIDLFVSKKMKDNINIEISSMTTKHNLGQYFTTHNELKEKVFEFILNSPSNILEPSIGQGDLITHITDKTPSVTFDMYEISRGLTVVCYEYQPTRRIS